MGCVLRLEPDTFALCVLFVDTLLVRLVADSKMSIRSTKRDSIGIDSVHLSRRDALDWLMGRINYERTAFVPYQERQLKLDRMRQLLTRLGQPDAGLKIVHIAGTKGKGSTSVMIAAMLTAAGYRTGVFSSPHLERIEERFAVDGRPCYGRRIGDARKSPEGRCAGDGRRSRGRRRTHRMGRHISKSRPRWRCCTSSSSG